MRVWAFVFSTVYLLQAGVADTDDTFQRIDTICLEVGEPTSRVMVRDYGRKLTVAELDDLKQGLIKITEEESLTRSDLRRIHIAPAALVSGLVEQGTQELLELVLDFDSSARSELIQRVKHGPIDSKSEPVLDKKFILFGTTVAEALEVAFVCKDKDLFWKLATLSLTCPRVWIRNHGVYWLEKWISDRGFYPAPRKELRQVIANVRGREKELNNPDQPFYDPVLSELVIERLGEILDDMN